LAAPCDFVYLERDRKDEKKERTESVDSSLPSSPSASSLTSTMDPLSDPTLPLLTKMRTLGVPYSLAQRFPHRGRGRSSGSSLPPSFEAVVSMRHTFYFLAESGSPIGVIISDRMIRAACGGICTVGNSKLLPWASTIKVHSLTLWNPSTTTAGTQSDVYWVSTGTGFVRDAEKFRVTPEGVTNTAPTRFYPPEKSLVADWIADDGTATNLFGIACLNGAVLALDVSFTLSNNLIAVASTITTGTLANVYYLALDGPSSNKLVPQGVPTTS